MVSIFHEELESGIGQVHKVGGHAAEDEKQIQTLSMCINHTGSVHMYLLSFINFSLLQLSSSEKGEGGGLLERGDLIEDLQYLHDFFPLKLECSSA